MLISNFFVLIRFKVSVTLTTEYVAAARLGETVFIEGKVLKSGKTLAFLEGTIFNDRGQVLMKCHHTKFVGPGTAALPAKL